MDVSLLYEEAKKLARKAPERGHARYVQYLTLRRLGEYKTTVTPLLDEVTSAVNRRRAADKKAVRGAARLILANLAQCVFSRDWLAISRREDAYTTGQYLKKDLYLSYGATTSVLDKMVEMGWLEPPVKGNSFSGNATMYAPTPELEQMLVGWVYLVEKPFKPPYMFKTWDEVQEGRKGKTRLREPVTDLPPDHPEIARLVALNEYLSQQSYALKAPIQLLYRKHEEPYFLNGGRVYTDIQRLPARKAKVRLNTLINGSPVIEIDLKANHLRMAAAIFQKEEIAPDPYIDIANKLGVTRNQVKLVINRSIGSRNVGQNEWGAAHPDDDDGEAIPTPLFRAVMEQAKQTYPLIPFNEGLGLKLQSLEGAIMMKTMERLMKLDIVSLPIHDAIMVPDRLLCRVAAEGALKEVWAEELNVNFKPHTEVKEP
jgi:hypothetical protein